MDGLYLLWWVQEKQMSPALVAAVLDDRLGDRGGAGFEASRRVTGLSLVLIVLAYLLVRIFFIFSGWR